jgi:hypothetical protein
MSLQGTNNIYRLISPHIDFYNVTNGTPPGVDFLLNYSTTYNFDSNQQGWVEINVSGNTETIGNPLSGDSDNDWINKSINITDYWEQNFTIEFIFDSDNVTSTNYYWIVDNINIDVLRWYETVELDDSSIFGYGNTTDWINQSWGIDTAYQGSGNYWTIEYDGGNAHWNNSNAKNLENGLESQEFFLPSAESILSNGYIYNPSIKIRQSHNFGQTQDHVDLEISNNNGQTWFLLQRFEGSSSGEQESFVTIPGQFTGIDCVSRFKFVSGENYYDGPIPGFDLRSFEIGIFPFDDDTDGTNYMNVMETTINFQTQSNYAHTEVKIKHVKSQYRYLTNIDHCIFTLTWLFEENIGQVPYHDWISWSYTLYYVTQGEDIEIYSDGGDEMIDGENARDESDEDRYNSEGRWISPISVRVNRERYNDENSQGAKIVWSVTSYRDTYDLDAITEGRFNSKNDILEQKNSSDSNSVTLDIVFVKDQRTIDTGIILYCNQDEFDLTPNANEPYYLRGDGIAITVQAAEPKAEITFLIDCQYIEWSNNNDIAKFIAQIWEDKNGDHKIDKSDGDNKIRTQHIKLDDVWTANPWAQDTEKTGKIYLKYTFDFLESGTYIVRCKIQRSEKWWALPTVPDFIDESFWTGYYYDIEIIVA